MLWRRAPVALAVRIPRHKRTTSLHAEQTLSRRGLSRGGEGGEVLPNGISLGNLGKLRQNMTTSGNMLQHMTCGNMCALTPKLTKCKDLWHFYENPVCPDTVWKPATIVRSGWGVGGKLAGYTYTYICVYTYV